MLLVVDGSWGSVVYLAARYVRWNAALDVDNKWFALLSCGRTTEGMACAYAGVYRTGDIDYWAVYYYNGATPGLTWNVSAVEALPSTNYNIEVGMYRHDTAGWVRLWVDGVLVIEITGVDTLAAGDRTLDYARFGANFADAPVDSDLIVYMDDCRVNHKRIGRYDDGYFITETHTASAGLTRWGQLDSPDVLSSDHRWKIKDGIGTILISNLDVPVDLDAAGLDETETDIQIMDDIIHKQVEWPYVVSISLSEYVLAVDGAHDGENCYQGLRKLADPLGAEVKLTYDDEVDFLDELGDDKSSDIVFFTARSQSMFPGKKPNIVIVNRRPDWSYYANCIQVIGGTVESVRITAQAKDSEEVSMMSSILGGNHNGEIWYVVRDPEILTVGGAAQRAETELGNRKILYESITGEVVDLNQAGALVRGDYVTLNDKWTSIDASVRVVGITRQFSGQGLEKVTLELQRKIRSHDFAKFYSKTDALLRYATA